MNKRNTTGMVYALSRLCAAAWVTAGHCQCVGPTLPVPGVAVRHMHHKPKQLTGGLPAIQ
jgi:hypothetical protein